MNLTQVLNALRGRRKLVLRVFFGVVLLVVVVSLIRTKQYTAVASVVVETKSDPVAGVMYQAPLMSADVATQVDIISSARVARSVVKSLKMAEMPDIKQGWQEATGGQGDIVAWIAEYRLAKRLLVTPSRDSDVINIAVSWPDPKFAAALANAFAQAYIETNIELKVDPAKQYLAWFNDRSKQLRDELEAKQNALSSYQSKNGIIAATDDRYEIENTKLAELSTQLLQVQALQQDSQSRQRQAGIDPESLPEVGASPVIANLKAQLGIAEANLSNVAAELGRNHPDYQTAEAAVVALRQRIAREASIIAASLSSANSVNRGREADLRAAFDAQKNRVLELKSQHDQLTLLQGDVTAAQRNLDAVSQRLAQTSLESQSKQTNISLLTPAAEPLKPSSPRLVFNTALGIVLGMVLGVGIALMLELMDKRVRDADDVNALLGVPLLATIPKIKIKDAIAGLKPLSHAAS